MASPSAEKVTRLVIANDYQWIGNPRAAGFVVYIDGGRVGVASLGNRLSVTVDPGAHVLRVRLWYFRGLVDPFHWLSLEEVGKL